MGEIRIQRTELMVFENFNIIYSSLSRLDHSLLLHYTYFSATFHCSCYSQKRSHVCIPDAFSECDMLKKIPIFITIPIKYLFIYDAMRER